MDKHSDNHIDKNTEAFIPPRHWIGVEELDGKYWSNPATKEKRGQEFFDKPVEAIDALDRSSKGGMARRDFLTVMGASMAMASFACARRPVHKIIPYVVQPEEIVPGNANYYASTSRVDGSGILVKTREGRPIKIEGNPDHPINRGKLTAQSQAAVLSLYDPDRLKAPLFNPEVRSSGSSKEVSWEDADRAIGAKLKSASRVRVLTGDMRSDSTNRAIREFLAGFSNGAHVQYDSMALNEIAEGQAVAYGTAVVPRYRYDQADVIVSLGSDFMGADLNAVENRADWAKHRKLNSKAASQASLSKLYAFESAFTITGSNADKRIPVRAGDELKIALAIAHQLISVDKHTAFASDSQLNTVLEGYKPSVVAEEIGIEGGAALIAQIAKELWESRGKGLVVGGSFHTRTKDQMALQVAVNLLNSALENEGATVDGTVDAASATPSLDGITKLVAEMKSGAVDALIIYRTNPVFNLPNSGFEEAMKKVSLVVVVNDYEDETALNAHYVLADHHFLENWGDWNPRKGIYSLQQPAMAPMHSTRAFEDGLIAWVKSGAVRGSGLIAQAADWHGYVKSNWEQTMYKESGATGSPEQFWESTLQLGVLNMKSAKGQMGARPSARHFNNAALAQLPKFAPSTSGTQLVLFMNNSIQDGRYANNPWLQELPDPLSSATWDNYLAIGPALAKKLSVENDNVVSIKSGNYSVELPVYIQPGMHPSVAAIAVGYGRTAAGKVGNDTGKNVYPFVAIEGGRQIFAGASVEIAKTQKFYKLATTQWHTATENRPVVNDITLAEFKKNPGAAAETDPELRVKDLLTLWPVHEYKGYRWGMSIDLNSCMGCAACSVACQAENNVPIVGRAQVRVARQMNWIRIDRYYSGSAENPEVVYQPMLCQHCENAPCETVCPVLATVHDDEGLNVQVYNRCVGTRYCQNNCPYKVRRFNFFDHWKSYEGTMNLVWNPDVTVRTRGIMEKCTFCVQRIVDAKDKAKDRSEKVADKDLQTACQQTCPTDAIVFGDINNPGSAVSKLKSDARTFRVLETLNTKPQVSYMTKVRNKPSEKEEAANEHGGANA
jgi:Fe-S-cluster-containing dehydrogenase component/anaerobic selenocysteine-containing dehydrogenase